MVTKCYLSVIWQARYRFATCGVERENVKVVGFVGSEIFPSATTALYRDLKAVTLATLWPDTKHMDRILDQGSIRTSDTSRRESQYSEIACWRQAVVVAGGSMVSEASAGTRARALHI
jgi:hypothetical protein